MASHVELTKRADGILSASRPLGMVKEDGISRRKLLFAWRVWISALPMGAIRLAGGVAARNRLALDASHPSFRRRLHVVC